MSRPGLDGGGLRLVTVAQGLEGPTGLAYRPGDPDRLYVTEQTGRIRIVEDGRFLPRPFLDLRARVLAGGERGLLGLVFAPDHAGSGLLYVHYTNRRGDTRVVRYRARGDRVEPGSARTLLSVRQPYENHKGGQLAFDRRGRLHLGLGDGGSAFDPERRGQDLGTSLGKVLRREGARSRAKWKTVAYGLRNPWRFSFDRATGDLWIADVGQDRQEEINVLPAGERGLVNFGWSAYEGTYRWRTRAVNPRGRLAAPVTAYGRRYGCSVTGGYVYRGRTLPRLRGRYLYGDLCTGTIWSLRRRPGARPAIRRERVKLPLLTSFAEDRSGELYAVSLDGRVVALRAAGGGAQR
ncbi:MAG: PQQ-dependent sugar dehydrogenase [Thermoleophilaceae bacterium]|nr:PQQ-dependent sugar dehydrogenase [Thermoleophilaceae bacterium]